ncbi:unnamed protein product [Arctogadus glacialis]
MEQNPSRKLVLPFSAGLQAARWGPGGAASRPDRTAEANISRALLARSRSSLKSNGNPFSAVPEECSNQNIIVNVV